MLITVQICIYVNHEKYFYLGITPWLKSHQTKLLFSFSLTKVSTTLPIHGVEIMEYMEITLYSYLPHPKQPATKKVAIYFGERNRVIEAV